MRRLLLVALVAALAIGVAQSESPEMQQEEDCDPSLIEADSSEGSASLSSSSAAFAPYHVGVAAGNPNNRQPFVSAAEAGMQPPIVDARPPVVIVQQPARRACKKASTSNIKLKNNNAVQEISLPEGADISEYADLLNGDFNPAQKAAASSSSSSSSAKRSSSSSGSEKMSSLSHGLYGESSSRHSKKSESSLFSGSFGESSRHAESGRRESSIGSLTPLSSQSQRQSNSLNSNQGNNNNNNGNNNNNNNNNNQNNNNNNGNSNNQNSNNNNNNNNNNQRSENSLSFSDSHSGSESGTNTLFSNSGSGSNSNTNSGSALNSNTQGSLANSGSQQAVLSAQRQRAPFGNAVVGSSVMSVDAASLKRVIDRRTFFLTQKRLFKTSIHFRAGVNSFRLFDYAPSKANPNDPDNLGGYHDEWKAFPDAWANMLKTLGEVGITLRKDKKIYLHIAGFSSSKYPGRPEHFALSERRATATACYLAAWLRAQGMPNFAFKIGFYGDKYASGQDPLSYAKDRRVDIMYALNTESYKNFIPQFHWKGGSTIKKGGHDGGLSEYCSRNANWRRPDFQDSYLQYAGPNAAPAGASAVAGGASGSSGSSNIDPETFEGVMFGSGSSAVQASAAALSASAGSSSLAASLSAQQRSSSSSGVAVAAGVPSLSASLSGLPVSSSVASAALPVASSVAGSGSALPANSIHSSLSNTGLPSTTAPASSSAAAASSSDQPSSATVPTGPRGPLIKLQNSNQAVIQDTPHPPRRSRRGFVIGKGPQSEGSKTVFGSPITGQ